MQNKVGSAGEELEAVTFSWALRLSRSFGAPAPRPRPARHAHIPPAPRRVRAPPARRRPSCLTGSRMRPGRSVGERPALRAMESLSAERQEMVQKLEDPELARELLQDNSWQLEEAGACLPAVEAAASSGRSAFGESATKRQRQDKQPSSVRFVATVPSMTVPVEQLKAGLRLGGAMRPAVAIDLPADTRGTKGKVKQAKQAVSFLYEGRTIFVADRHTMLVRPGGAQGGRKTMAEIEKLINPIGPYQVSAEIFPIGVDTNQDLYTNTKSLFLGHFQALGNSENRSVDAEGWSEICAEGIHFHYKGTPAKLACKDEAEETPGFILIIERPVVTFYFVVLPDVPLASHACVLSVLRD